MSGKDYLLYISADGTSVGAKTAIELQGDMSLNFGKSVSKTAYKNGAKSSQGNEGISGSCSFGDEAPLPAGIVLLWDAHDNDGAAYLWIESSKTGGKTWEGNFKVAITELTAPTEGEVSHSLEFSEDGTITRGTVV
ncbi:hypothetical protein AB9F29_19575 [Falsihalocynthiibacter sp. S25ZX9]|uniref:hypothetical protein n=1 Tax=unclassified Falsihalocynthiibacter TaxID=2854191 RepID=UPI003510AA26